MVFKAPSNPNHSTILRNWDQKRALSVESVNSKVIICLKTVLNGAGLKYCSTFVPDHRSPSTGKANSDK